MSTYVKSIVAWSGDHHLLPQLAITFVLTQLIKDNI